MSQKTSIDDALAPHRARLMYLLSLVAIPALLPFAINDFFRDRAMLGWAILAVLATLGVDAWAIRQARRPPIPFELLLVPMSLGMAISLRTQGVMGALWFYPTVLFMYFVLRRGVANACCLLLGAAGTAMIDRYIDPGVALRFAATLALCMLIINIILNVMTELQGQMLGHAITDPLTGAFNRRHMVASLGGAHAPALPAALLLIDVDHFKSINDRFGHEAGDGVLKRLATMLRSQFHDGDMLFRLGGDEFLLFLPGSGAAEGLAHAQRTRVAVSDTAILRGDRVTVSIGVAARRAEDTLDAWIHRADTALYEAKRAGRNRVACDGVAA
jgi:diguanylate cyclase (GGDEF)-like protein